MITSSFGIHSQAEAPKSTSRVRTFLVTVHTMLWRASPFQSAATPLAPRAPQALGSPLFNFRLTHLLAVTHVLAFFLPIFRYHLVPLAMLFIRYFINTI
jgi:hypothetical protein